MKPLRKSHSTSNSCSCTSCIYNSESGHPSLQRLALKGSKIDRLYYGKYIPLREKKLLDKLVRTRAVYDDIRAQLVSESASNLQKNADFNVKSSPSNELEKGSAVLEIINLVDKGAALKSSHLSECCSCCSCSSTTHFHQNKRSRKLHQRRNGPVDRYERVTLRQDMKNRKGVKFLPKHIKSDPCTCTYQFFGKQKYNLDSNIESSLNNDEEIQPRTRKFSKINKKSLQNIIDSKTKLKNKITGGVQMIKNSKTLLQDTLAIRVKESLEKVRQLKNNLKPLKKTPAEDQYYIEENPKVTKLKNAGRLSYEKIRASQKRFKNKILEGEEIFVIGAKKSFGKMKRTTNKINNNIKGSMDRLIEKNKHKKKTKIIDSLPPEKHTEVAVKIRKDSIAKFKDDINRRKLLLDWMCEEGCIENTCDPEQCFEKLKFKKSKHVNRDIGITNITNRKHRKKITEKSSNVKIQTEPALKKTQINQNISVPDKTIKPKIKVSNKKLQKLTKKQKRSIVSPNKRNELGNNRTGITSTSNNGPTSHQTGRIGSYFSLKVDYEDKPLQTVPRIPPNFDRDNTQSSGITISHQKIQKRNKVKQGEKGSQVSLTKKHILKLTKKHRLAPVSKQSYTSSRKTKSTSSITSKINSSRANRVQSVIIPRLKQIREKKKLKLSSRKVIGKSKPRHNRNVVRIGSTFSFNIEFSRNSRLPNRQDIENWTDVNSLSVKPKGIQKERYRNYHGRNLHKEKKRKTSTASTVTMVNSENTKTRNRSTVTEKLYYLQFEPHECEPGIGVPGKCNPYECFERIMKRRNTRDVSLSTVSPENKSTYSYTTNKSKSAFIQSKPKTKVRKILVKRKVRDTKIREPHVAKVEFENRSKQAVNIGSSFSFNIEFSKNYTKKDIKPSPRPINLSTRKKVEQKGVEIEKKVGNVDTHMDTIRKSEKSSSVGPMLKRCFCTLNLYKKQKGDFNKLKKKQPLSTAYTINTAFIETNKSALPKQKMYNDLLLKQSTLHLLPIHRKFSTKQSLEITSDLSLNVELVKKSLKSYNTYLKQSSSTIATSSSSSYLNRRKSFTGLSNYLKRCFYIMNMQYEKRSRKLEPYECEPGVCIPGQCDPYVCQKRIMKRLQRGYSKLSGTSTRARSISSSQTAKPLTKSHVTAVAVNPQHKKKEKSKQTFKSQRNVQGNKQAVRIGSSFSFDVEFYKNTGQKIKYKDHESKRLASKSKVTVSSRKTGNREKYMGKNVFTKPDIKHNDSQFSLQTKHQGSAALEDMNRCFCTLKLHKKGKLKTHSTQRNQTTLPYEHLGIASVSRGQNTKDFKGVGDLLPYECEPGICIPGECNPYECLTRINKRYLRGKRIGTVTQAAAASSNTVECMCERAVGTTVAKKSTSAASSNTIGRKNKLQTRSVKIKQIKSKANSMRRVDTSKFIKTPPSTKHRQAVNIGSSFSFNIEFYKDANSFKSKKNVVKDKRRLKYIKSGQKRSQHKKENRSSNKISTVLPTSHTRISQTSQSSRKNMGTTVKPFLKRCFCTLQLRNQKEIIQNSNLLKNTKYKSTMTMTEITDNKRKLDPYECEPGICIPYKCDPYDCEKLIKNRVNNAKYELLPYECEPNVCTPGQCDPRVCFERIKNRNNLKKTSVVNAYSKSIKNKHKNHQFKRPSIENHAVNKRRRKTRHEQHVKAPSNISFKEKVKSGILSNLQRCFCTMSLRKNLHAKTINQATTVEPNITNTQAITPAASAVNTFIKKCFCTLKLNREKNTPQIKFDMTPHEHKNKKIRKLKPYECEPYTCTPGECDPYECEKRIRKRLLLETTTGHTAKKHTHKRNNLKKRKRQRSNTSIRKHDASQLTFLQTKSTSTLSDPLLKRCFCTLQLHKSAPPKQSSPTKNKITNTKNADVSYNVTLPYECPPYFCVPNQCNPYECEKNLRHLNHNRHNRQTSARELETVATATQERQRKHQSIEVKPLKNPSQKTQSNKLRKVSASRQQKNVVEIPRFTNYLNKDNLQGLKIGSNMSFNMEFYKEYASPVPTHKSKKNRRSKMLNDQIQTRSSSTTVKKKQRADKDISSLASKIRNAESQIKHKTDNKSSNTINKLKRCFCTLTLQKSIGNTKVPFPQAFEVRRVAVRKSEENLINNKSADIISKDNKMQTILSYKPKKFNKKYSDTLLIDNNVKNRLPKKRIKWSSKKRLTKKQSAHPIDVKTQKCSCFYRNKTMLKSLREKSPTIQNTPDKILKAPYSNHPKAKKNKQNTDNMTCSFSNCPKYKKFKQKTVDNNLKCTCSDRPKAKILKQITRDNNLKCTCSDRPKAKILKQYIADDNLKSSLSDTPKAKKFKQNTLDDNLKCTCSDRPKAKILKQTTRDNNLKCTCSDRPKAKILKQNTPDNNLKCSCSDRPNSKNIKQNIADDNLKSSLSDSPKAKKLKQNTLDDNLKCSFSDCPKAKIVKQNTPDDSIKCYCSYRPKYKKIKQFSNLKTSKSVIVTKKDIGRRSKNFKKNINSLAGNKFEAGDTRDNTQHGKIKSVKKYMKESNKRNLKSKKSEREEITKAKIVRNDGGQCAYCCRHCGRASSPAMGDFLLNKLNSCIKKVKVLTEDNIISKIKRKFAVREKKQEKELKPMFNVYLEADSFSIINKEEVTEKVTRLQSKSGSREKKVHRKKHDKLCTCCICLGKKEVSEKTSKINNNKKAHPCVCGSEICAADVKNMRKPKLIRKKIPSCFCGSPICAQETQMLKAIAPGENICMCKKEMEERKKKYEKEFEKSHKLLLAENRHTDRVRRRLREKNDKLLEKSIKGNKSDILLVSESVVDVAKLGFTGVGDILRILYRCARDPKHTWHSMKAMAKDPRLIAKTLQDTCHDTGVFATARRIGKRVSNMGTVEEAKRLLEQHDVTNYLLHIADKDPKKRLRKRKKIPQKEQLNLGCSLYASSLRKRRFLWIFNRWPWFYPHCMSIFNVWKQFADLMTFLLALVVWSPCILATEICRAIMCCTMCTG